ncbi:hypothetical protein DPMN_120837 [Dreissena polymorpha]|uniref:Uncharacterized protein n=1 Tax=Dreissena polymorpha TaxID=45954 RepID=A0A9D4GPB6_DREPO|nr:hypothetical protein DPMN_120837 [Dreissena polymorpha]
MIKHEGTTGNHYSHQHNINRVLTTKQNSLDIIRTNVSRTFHDDWAKNASNRHLHIKSCHAPPYQTMPCNMHLHIKPCHAIPGYLARAMPCLGYLSRARAMPCLGYLSRGNMNLHIKPCHVLDI